MTIVVVALVVTGVLLLCIGALWLWSAFSQLKATMEAVGQELHRTRAHLSYERLWNNNTHLEGGGSVRQEERRTPAGLLREES